MSDDSDDKDGADGFDWLAGRFAPTEQVPQQPDAPAAAPIAPPPAAPATTPFAQPLPPTPSFVPNSAPAAPAATPVIDPAAGEPTRALSWDEFAASQAPAAAPAQPTPAAGYLDQPTEAYSVQSWQPAATSPASPAPVEPFHDEAPSGSGETSAIDALFGDHQFQAYEEVGVLGAVQATAPTVGGGTAPREPRAPLSTTQRVLIGVAGGLIVVLVVIAMYFLGVHLGKADASTPTAASTGTATNTPTPAGSGGPASPGVQQWSALQGGECIQPFSSAWATTFTVVSCSSDHDAQMVFKGKLPDSADTAYPLTSQFQTELTALCSAPTAINYSAASAVTDLQISFSYPPNETKWIAGDRTYYCFIDRQSGGNLPGDLSVQATSTSN